MFELKISQKMFRFKYLNFPSSFGQSHEKKLDQYY